MFFSLWINEKVIQQKRSLEMEKLLIKLCVDHRPFFTGADRDLFASWFQNDTNRTFEYLSPNLIFFALKLLIHASSYLFTCCLSYIVSFMSIETLYARFVISTLLLRNPPICLWWPNCFTTCYCWLLVTCG